MTDRYEKIRKALALLDSDDYCERATGYSRLRNACDPDTLRALLAERDALAAGLEAAREDAERLDWLASKAPHLYVDRDHGCYELPYFDITSGRDCCDPGDLRAAIDRARGKGVAE